MDDVIRSRNRQLSWFIESTRCCDPYDNYRPINVPGRFDGYTLLQCMVEMHPHIDPPQWQQWFRQGHIRAGDLPVAMGTIVRGGNQFQHLFPDWVEPDVNPLVKILWEDDALIGVYKPAPLPVHPSGRFNRNTLIRLLQNVYEPRELRLVHRLDANTTGVVLLARSADAANRVRLQFEQDAIKKIYLVRCQGHPPDDSFRCEERISESAGPAGQRSIDPNGLEAITEFQVLRRMVDGTTFLRARPITGRTNQIRIHLWGMGFPVSGDSTYLQDRALTESQTKTINDPMMCLHASELSLVHPIIGRPITITSADPDWFDP